MDLAHRRGPGKTLCPSDVARSVDPEAWRPLMPQVREVGAKLVQAGALKATQKGVPVDPLSAKGPIRFGLPDREA